MSKSVSWCKAESLRHGLRPQSVFLTMHTAAAKMCFDVGPYHLDRQDAEVAEEENFE